LFGEPPLSGPSQVTRKKKPTSTRKVGQGIGEAHCFPYVGGKGKCSCTFGDKSLKQKASDKAKMDSNEGASWGKRSCDEEGKRQAFAPLWAAGGRDPPRPRAIKVGKARGKPKGREA